MWLDHGKTVERLSQVRPVVQHGWCELVNKATVKGEVSVPLAERQGYIQLSFDGLNHVRAISLPSNNVAERRVILGCALASSCCCRYHSSSARKGTRGQSSVSQCGLQKGWACDLGATSRESEEERLWRLD